MITMITLISILALSLIFPLVKRFPLFFGYFYFIRKPASLPIDVLKLFRHLDCYPAMYMLENITNLQKKLVHALHIMVLSNYFVYFNAISVLRNAIKNFIPTIYSYIHLDLTNTMVNFDSPRDLSYVFIAVDRTNPSMESMKSCYNELYNASSDTWFSKPLASCSGLRMPTSRVKYISTRNAGSKKMFLNPYALSLSRLYTTDNSHNRYSACIKDLVNTNMYIVLSNILNEDIPAYEKQKKIESVVKDFHYTDIVKSLKTQTGFRYNEGFNLLMSNLPMLTKSVDELKRNGKYLKNKKYCVYLLNTPTECVISVVITNVIGFMVKHPDLESQSVTQLYFKIAKHLVRAFYNYQYNLYREWCATIDKIRVNVPVDDIKYKFYLVGSKSVVITNRDMTLVEFIQFLDMPELDVEYIGVKYAADMTEHISRYTDMYRTDEYRISETSSRRVILPDVGFNSKLLNMVDLEGIGLPMICKPTPWEVEFAEDLPYKITKYGGYLTNEEDKIHFIRESFKNKGSTILQDSTLINAVNYLQSSELCINKDVLNVILNNLELLKEVIHLDYHVDTPKLYLYKQYKKADLVYNITHYNSLSYNNRAIISNALLFKDQSFYLPVFVDWRARLYTKTSPFTYQGCELSKCFITFKYGTDLNESGLKSLKVYTANCYGFAKKSKSDRIKWVEENLSQIIDIDSKYWMSGKEPLLSLACSIELKKYTDNPQNFKSHLPIYIDATCNGLQHLSSMSNDVNLAKFVNIAKTGDSDVPQDVYSEMINKVKQDIQSLVSTEYEHAVLTKISITREFIKRGIMTIPYGVTIKGVSDQLKKDHFIQDGCSTKSKQVYLVKQGFMDASDINHVRFTNKNIYQLAKIIHNILYKTFTSIDVVVKYLKEMNSFLKKFNVDIAVVWKTPSGLVIEQRYVKFEKKKIFTTIAGKELSITLKKPLTDINTVKQNQGIVPNLVHSMDAANIALLIKGLTCDSTKYLNLLTIHDCFATNANNVELLSLEVRKAFLSIYKSQEFIKDFHEYILNYLDGRGIIIEDGEAFLPQETKKPIKIPDLPVLSKNDDYEFNIMNSSYFLH